MALTWIINIGINTSFKNVLLFRGITYLIYDSCYFSYLPYKPQARYLVRLRNLTDGCPETCVHLETLSKRKLCDERWNMSKIKETLMP
jgi:hypothetical protein